MDWLTNPPDVVANVMPLWGWWTVLVGGALIAVLVIVKLFKSLIALLFGSRPTKPISPNLMENFADYPPLKPSTGDRRLQIEGTPIRLRLVVLAPVGSETVDADDAEDLLEKLVAGLRDVVRGDRPRIRVWPRQVSFPGFAQQVHHATPTPEGEGELSRWIVVAGRAKFAGGRQVMIGLGLHAIKPSPIGHRTIDAHEWSSVLRVRVRD